MTRVAQKPTGPTNIWVCKGQVGPQHVERAVGKIDDPHDPKDNGQTRGHQEEDHGPAKAADTLDKDHGRIN